MLGVAVESLARANGWLSSQLPKKLGRWYLNVDRPEKRVTFELNIAHPGYRVGVDLPTAALWLLLEASGLPKVELGPCPACERRGSPRESIFVDGSDRHGSSQADVETPTATASGTRPCSHCSVDGDASGRVLRTPAQLVLASVRREFGPAPLLELNDGERRVAEQIASEYPFGQFEAEYAMRLGKSYAPHKHTLWAVEELARRNVDIMGFEASLREEWRPSTPDRRAVAGLRQLAAQLDDEALVLADRWQSEGVGLSTVPIPSTVFARETCWRNDGKTRCRRSAEWMPPDITASEGPFYCHEHRPLDGWGDQLAVAIAKDEFWDRPGDDAKRLPYSPRLGWLINLWLDGILKFERWSALPNRLAQPEAARRAPRLTAALRWALNSAIDRCPTACRMCRSAAEFLCSVCDGRGRLPQSSDTPAETRE